MKENNLTNPKFMVMFDKETFIQMSLILQTTSPYSV